MADQIPVYHAQLDRYALVPEASVEPLSASGWQPARHPADPAAKPSEPKPEPKPRRAPTLGNPSKSTEPKEQ